MLQAQAQTEISGSALFPSLSLQGEAQRARNGAGQIVLDPTTGQPTGQTRAATGNTFGLTLDASYELDIWGKARANLTAADQLLLAERISIRDLSTILEGIADALAFSRNPATMVEHVRARLARQICAQNTSHNGYLPLIALSAKWEQAFAESIIGQGEDKNLAMQPSKLSEFMAAVRDAFERAAREGEAPVLVTSAAIRPFVRSLIERFRQQTTVLSQAEIHPRARLKTVGSV